MLGLIPIPSPMNVTFILSREDPAVVAEFWEASLGHDAGAPAPYHLWEFFFREGFLSRVDRMKGRAGSWHVGNDNVYRRHPWNRRDDLPDGWEGDMNGLRRLGLRWWHRSWRQM